MYLSLIFRSLFFLCFFSLCFWVFGKEKDIIFFDKLFFTCLSFLGILGIVNTEESFFLFFIPIVLLILLKLFFDHFHKEEPEETISFLIHNGKINFSKLEELSYPLEDFVEDLKRNHVTCLEEVKEAYQEKDGTLIVSRGTLDYPYPLIFQGKIFFEWLHYLGKDEYYIYQLLKEKNLSLEDIYYAFYAKEKTFIITKKMSFR